MVGGIVQKWVSAWNPGIPWAMAVSHTLVRGYGCGSGQTSGEGVDSVSSTEREEDGTEKSPVSDEMGDGARTRSRGDPGVSGTKHEVKGT